MTVARSLMLVLLAAVAQAADSGAAAPAPAPAQPNEAASYSLGLSFATQWRDSGLRDLLSQDGLVRGIRAGLAGTALTAEDRERASTLMHDAYTAWSGRNLPRYCTVT